MQRSEIWAVDCSRVEDFFRSQPDVNPTGGEFRYGSCEIRLESLPLRRMGGLSFPQTCVSFNGEEENVNEIYHRFFMRFVSAGG